MSTKKVTLTAEWQQITSGKETVFIQSRSGNIAICDNQSKPGDDYPFVVITEAAINPPAVIWAKTFCPGTSLVVLNPGQ
ncbi:hypothetical protein V6Z26_000073 [Escherichia coli]